MLSNRPVLNLISGALGLDPATIQDDSVLEHRVRYLLKNHDTVTGALAAGTLTISANFSDGETVTIGSVVYRFKTVPVAAYDVAIGGTASISLDNLKAAINASGTPGTEYFAGTFAHPLVTAGTKTATTLVVNARFKAIGNSIATTETGANSAWGAATLAGGLPGMVAPAATDVAAVSGGQPG